MRRLGPLIAFAVGLALGSVIVVAAQPGVPNFGSTQAQKHRAREYDRDGDRVGVNIRGVSTTPTPALPDRCFSYCDAATGQLKMSFDGGPFSAFAGETGCACPGAGTDSTCVGSQAACAGDMSVCVGDACSAGDDATCVGGVCAAVDGGTGYGSGVIVSGECIAVGRGAQCAGAGHVIIGTVDANAPINDPVQIFFGGRQEFATPPDIILQPPQGVGTNVVGADTTISSGRPTGNGLAGSIFFRTSTPGSSGSILGTLASRWQVEPDGDLVPVTNNAYHLGSTALRVALVHMNGFADDVGQWDLASGHIVPTINLTQDLGSGDIGTPLRIRRVNAGEINLSGVTGSGKAVCVKADGDLGVCADAVGAGGTCTCG